jgi:hypothetical protein
MTTGAAPALIAGGGKGGEPLLRCPRCDAPNARNRESCSKCGADLFGRSSWAGPAPSAKGAGTKRPPAKIWGWLFVIGAGLWAYGTLSSNHAASVPQVPVAPVVPVVAGIGDGTFRVGSDIAPGTYRAANPDGFCYWARLSGTGGTLREIIANDNTTGPAVVTIAATDAAFESTGCGGWTKP